MVSRISEALCHARFYGDNPSSDEIPLMKILQVLRTLLLSECGKLLSNDNVWEIFKACFNICFETRLSELLRHSAYITLDNMVAAIFSNLNLIAEKDSEEAIEDDRPSVDLSTDYLMEEREQPGFLSGTSSKEVDVEDPIVEREEESEKGQDREGGELPAGEGVDADQFDEGEYVVEDVPDDNTSGDQEFTNAKGIHFTQFDKEKEVVVRPYGMSCVHRVASYLARAINPLEKRHSEGSILIGLKLVATALECGAYQLGNAPLVMNVIKDEFCRSLFAILKGNNVTLFSYALNNCFLLFEANRHSLKFQFEMFLQLLMMDIITSENAKMPFQKRELALEAIVMLCCIPHLPSELYVNYDCELYSSNVLETLAKTLSKNVFPTTRLQTTHLLSLQALLAIVDSIEANCTGSDNGQEKWLTSAAEKYSRLTMEAHFSDVGRALEETRTNSTSSLSGSLDRTLVGGVTKLFPVKRSASCSPVIPTATTQQGKSSSLEDVKEGEQEVKEGEMEMDMGSETTLDEPLPTADELMHLRQRKKLLLAGSDDFNMKASKGIKFLEGRGLISGTQEIAKFLVDNHYLNKAMIGDYIGDRRNTEILKAFVKQFELKGIPLVEGLRHFLETFRLPGEAPVISRIMEDFAEHWLTSNREDLGKEFVSKDGVYVLCYATMMLNTDLHNPQVRNKMTLEEFIRNQRKTNDGKDPPVDLLKRIYHSVSQQEFVMPDEHSGAVKDNYTWKTLLRRSNQPGGGRYIRLSVPLYYQDLYLILWGPAVAALSYVFENGVEEGVVRSAITGFKKCAGISAHYGLSDVFDNIIVTLCKFTSLSDQSETSTSAVLILGTNPKAQMSAKVMFSLAHHHGNILREGWKNILEVLWYLFKAKLLPKVLTEAEDFFSSEGKISLVREEPVAARADSGILSSIFSYNWLMSSEQSPQNKTTPQTDVKALKNAKRCVEECHPEELFSESKFLKPESLMELVKALSFSSQGSEVHAHLGTSYDEESAIFHLELLVTVVIENRDRIALIWSDVSAHFHRLILSSQNGSILKERAIVGLLRIANRIMSRDEVRSEILLSLRVLLMLPLEQTTVVVLRQISNGIHDIIQSNVSHIKAASDWLILMVVMEACSAGAHHMPREGVGSEEGLDQSDQGGGTHPQPMDPTHPITPSSFPVIQDITRSSSNFDVWAHDMLRWKDPQSFFRSSETLSLIVRGDRWLSRENFASCIHAVRTFAEASSTSEAIQYDIAHSKVGGPSSPPPRSGGSSSRAKSQPGSIDQQPHGTSGQSFATVTIQFLDLLHTLYTRVADIFYGPAPTAGRGFIGKSIDRVSPHSTDRLPVSSSHLWQSTFCPLLQGMARLCCDPRRNVRHTAIGYLQRALLAHDLQRLAPSEWEACFLEVFFPMLSRLLEGLESIDLSSLEETRMRAAQLLSKVFLQHLSPLLKLTNFKSLWLGILDVMEKYYLVENSESLSEAVPESLKNMLLVMSTAGLFGDVMETVTLETKGDVSSILQTPQYQLWLLSWQRIEKFLPNLKCEIFPTPKIVEPVAPPTDPHPPATHTQETTESLPAVTQQNVVLGNSPQQLQESGETPDLSSQPVVIQLHKPLPVLTGPK
jgi:brefeldin A-resistance guanine nucleotide exchange factor 1